MSDDENNIASLAYHRADKANDSRLWSPIDALEDLLRRMKAGEDKAERMAIVWQTQNEDGTWKLDYCVAGCTFPESISLSSAFQHRVLHKWSRWD